MNQGAYRQNLPQNPIVKVFAMIVAALFAVGAIFLGAVVIFFLVGFALLVWILFSVRLWWMRRQMRGRGGHAQTRTRTRTEREGGDIVEVEYRVVEERSPESYPRDEDK
ncbi:MAG: hypothetical protein ACR2QQ_10665 [Gammaproteobacteria bacterium]